MENRPVVSILMTSYNREKYIGAAIESVQASSFTDFELIISDDCSSDRTMEIARAYAAADPRIRIFINEKNLGDYPNRNQAASYARGEYLKYLDSDDQLYKYSLSAFVDFMEKDKEVAMGISYRKNITTEPFPVILTPAQSLRHHFFTEGYLHCAPTGTIIRRADFEKVGGFSGKRMIGDLEFGLKIAADHKVMLLPPGLFFWRHHGEQEVTYGLDNNMYGPLQLEVVTAQFARTAEAVITTQEKKQILRSLTRGNKRHNVKRLVARILRLRPR